MKIYTEVRYIFALSFIKVLSTNMVSFRNDCYRWIILFCSHGIRYLHTIGFLRKEGYFVISQFLNHSYWNRIFHINSPSENRRVTRGKKRILRILLKFVKFRPILIFIPNWLCLMLIPREASFLANFFKRTAFGCIFFVDNTKDVTSYKYHFCFYFYWQLKV